MSIVERVRERLRAEIDKVAKCIANDELATESDTGAVVEKHDGVIAYLEGIDRALDISQLQDLSDLAAEEAQLRNDAERYWILRNGSNWPATFSNWYDVEPLREEELDEALDASPRPTNRRCRDHLPGSDGGDALDEIERTLSGMINPFEANRGYDAGLAAALDTVKQIRHKAR